MVKSLEIRRLSGVTRTIMRYESSAKKAYDPIQRGSEYLYSDRSGRRLQLSFDGEEDVLKVLAPDGAEEFVVRLTSEGPVLQLRSARVELVATREVQVRCERFSVQATEQVELESAGDITQRAGGRAAVDAVNGVDIRGHSVDVVARSGGIGLRANDDVVVEGESIRLNP